MIENCGVVGPLLITIKERNGDTQLYCCAAIAHLLNTKSLKKSLLRETGVISPLLEVLSNSISPDTRRCATAALLFLSQDRDCRLYMVWETDLIQVLLFVLNEENKIDEYQQNQICQIFSNLVEEVELGPVLVSKGLIGELVKIIYISIPIAPTQNSQTPLIKSSNPFPIQTQISASSSYSSFSKPSNQKVQNRKNSNSFLNKIINNNVDGNNSNNNNNPTSGNTIHTSPLFPGRAVLSNLVENHSLASLVHKFPKNQVNVEIEETVICRICEENIPKSQFRAHSTYCRISSEIAIKILWYQNQLSRISDSLLQRQSYLEHLPGLHSAELQSISILLSIVNPFLEIPASPKPHSLCTKETQDDIVSKTCQAVFQCPVLQNFANQITNWTNHLISLKNDFPSSELSSPSSPPRSDSQGPNVIPQFPIRVITFKDFEILKTIGRGGYAKVALVKKKRTGDIYAMKMIKKKKLMGKNVLSQIRAERDILAVMDDPSIVKLYYSFETPKYVCLVMEFVSGGDCLCLLNNFSSLAEDVTKFYIAETALSLNWLHEHNIVHGDIKPANIMIGSDGHIKLTDFGLSQILTKSDSGRQNNEEESTSPPHKIVHGTPDYLAPEILQDQYQGKYSDWWSLGIVIFEFLVGIPPFHASTPNEIFQNILSSRITWPSDISGEVRDLILHLLNANPAERMGFDQLREHSWFSDIDWKIIRSQVPPFVPQENEWYFQAFSDTSSGPDSPPPATSIDEEESQISQNSFSFDFRNIKNLDAMNQAIEKAESPKLQRQNELKTEDREQNTEEDKTLNTEDGSQRTEDRMEKEEDREQNTEDRMQITEIDTHENL
eukprot:c21533_g1_i1.p1 GENE.c21533_g1_i1~~c21533_g1_i1.p1  ORF type:complete len:891 (+),score=312.88 c21533_g1_i1:163-2673(+)